MKISLYMFVILLTLVCHLSLFCKCHRHFKKLQVKAPTPNEILIQEIQDTCGKYFKNSNKEFFMKTVNSKLTLLKLNSKSAMATGKKLLSNCIRVIEFSNNGNLLLRKG